MSKKSKRAKQSGLTRHGSPMKQHQQRAVMPSRMYEALVHRIQYASEQIRTGDFAGCIRTCEAVLNSLPRRSEMRLEILAMLGLAHGMLKHYQQSYEAFNEAIVLDPTIAEYWYNRGLACSYMSRPGEAVRDLEHAVELAKNDTGEMARRFALQLQESRRELQEAMQAHEAGITFAQYMEREERFTQALCLVRQEKWQEAERLFRHLTATGSRIPSYWGNLGVCLMMQSRYDEAEEVLKQALTIDPDYSIARDNLRWLPDVRRSNSRIVTGFLPDNDTRLTILLLWSRTPLRCFQREQKRKHLPFLWVFEAQKAIRALFHVWETVPCTKRVLVKEIDGQARREERAEYLAEGMIPSIGGRVLQFGVLLGICP